MINPIKYKISEKEITIYTRRVFLFVGTGLFVLVSIPMLMLAYMHLQTNAEYSINIPSLLLSLLPLLFLFFLGSKKIIISEKDETIYTAYLFLKKSLARFSEIESIKYIDGGEYSYRAFLKADHYGKGIILTTITTNPNHLRGFEQNVLPVIQTMIFKEQQISQKRVSKITTIESFRYYHRNGSVFILKRTKSLIWNIFLMLLASVFFYFGLTTGIKEMLFFPIPMFLVGFGLTLQRKFFDVTGKTFTLSYGFFYRKVYPFNQFYNFKIVRKTTNGIYDGTDVKILFIRDDNPEPVEVSLRSFWRTQKIDSFLEETRNLLDEKILR